MGTLSHMCRWEKVTWPKLGCQKWVPDKTWLSEVVTWPKLIGEIWSPNQYVSARYGSLFIGQVTIFHRRVLVRWPLLTAEFWSGTHFWQPSFGSVTISHRQVLDRVPIFHRRLLRRFWNKAENKAKGNSFEAWHQSHSIIFVLSTILCRCGVLGPAINVKGKNLWDNNKIKVSGCTCMALDYCYKTTSVICLVIYWLTSRNC